MASTESGEREYTEYEKKVLKLNDELIAAVRSDVACGGKEKTIQVCNKWYDLWDEYREEK